MTHNNQDTLIHDFIEGLQLDSSNSLINVFSTIFNVAMQLERNKAVNAQPYERTDERLAHCNGFKDKTLKTRVGAIPVKIPQVRGGLEFYPKCIEKGCRSERALKVAIAQMYIQGVSTRKVSKIVEALCGFSVSSAQVSNASKILDDEIEKWRHRQLGAYKYLVVDARYEKVRRNQEVVSGAVLIAYGIDNNGDRRALGISVKISEAEVHWRDFLNSLVKRGLHGVEMITSDAHEGLKTASRAVFPTVPWQRCQFHIQQNAGHHVTKKDRKKEVAADLRIVFNAPNRIEAERFLKMKVEKYEKIEPHLSRWMEENVPESLTVFKLPSNHQKKLRTSNLAERQMQEIKRRTKIVRIFPNEKSLLRLVSALIMEVDEKWQTGNKYLNMEAD